VREGLIGLVAQSDRASDSESEGREFESRPNLQAMTSAELREIGERLYGPEWKAKMARALPVTTRTIRFWLAGDREIRPVIAERIKSLASS
jgi:hypothetical protein